MSDGLDGIQVQDSGGTSIKQWMGGIAKLRLGQNLTGSTASGVVTINAAGGGPGGGTPSDSVVALDGTSAAGASTDYSRGDHKHSDAARHAHANKASLDLVAGTNTGDQDLSVKLGLHAKADTAGAADTAVTLATGTDRTKLDGIASGATAGADWNTNVSNKPTLGTSAAKNIPASGDAAVTEVVYGTDTRLTNTRTPVAHSHAPADVTGTAVITTDSRLSDARTPTAHNQAESTITFTDITTGNVSTAAHGYLPKLPASTGLYLKDDLTWGAPSGAVADGDKGDITVSGSGATWTIDAGVVTEAKMTLADNTTGNVSASAHGFAPKVTDTSKFLKGDGTWATVTASTPDVALTNRVPTGSTTIANGYCAVMVGYLAIADGTVLDIQGDGVLLIL